MEEELIEMLEERGISPSLHRIKILKYLVEHRTHPTAEEIYDALVKEIPTLSRTTVYNSLKLFVKKGLIQELTIDGERLRYDANTRPHTHFNCLKCDRVIDIHQPIKLELRQDLIDGNKVTEWHLYLRGICKECLKSL
jgi:Fe2+ or Zn2+ uptake regulation protein